MAHHDTVVGCAHRTGRDHEFTFLDRDELSADETRGLHPTGQADDDHDVPDAGLEDGNDAQHEEDRGYAQHDVHEPHDDAVYPAAVIACQAPHADTDERGYADRD